MLVLVLVRVLVLALESIGGLFVLYMFLVVVVVTEVKSLE